MAHFFAATDTAGTEFVYNNGSYNLLASIVKRVSGQSLRDFAEANIFRPLGMSHTQFRDDAALLIANRAAGYTADEHGVHANPEAVVVGNSGLYTTPHDLLLWESNFDNPRVGTPELLAEMQKPAVLNNGKPTQYGFGLFLLNYRGQRTVEHSGGGSGVSSNLVRYPDQKLAIALQCNSDAIDPIVLTNKIADAYLADVLTKLPPAQPAPPRPHCLPQTCLPRPAYIAAFQTRIPAICVSRSATVNGLATVSSGAVPISS